MRGRARGQFLVEFALATVLCSGLLAGALTLARASAARPRALMLARFGALLLGTGRLADDQVQTELNDFAAVLSFGGKIRWQLETGRFQDTAASRFYRLVKTRVRASLDDLPLPIDEQVVVQQEEL